MLLLVLSLAVAVTAWLLATRAYPDRPIEAFVAAGLYGMGLTCIPLLALGWAGRLSRVTLSIAVLLGCAGLVVALLRRSVQGPLSEAGRSARAVLRAPWTAATERPFRHPSRLSVFPALLICAWTLFLSYLAPPSGWDGLWYHDPIVGFAIQNHGFSWVEVPGRLDMINGYPKTGELLHLWAALLGGRTFLEAPNSLLGPLLIAATYLLLRHFSVQRSTAVPVAVLFFLTPGVALQLRSTYVDMTFVTVVTATLCFLARPTLRPRDVATAALGLGLLAGVKSTGVVIAGLSILFLALRLPGQRLSWTAKVGSLLLAIVSVTLLAGPYYLRSWLRMDNPFWPAELHVAALDIDWNGPIRFAKIPIHARTLQVLFDWPKPDVQLHDTRDNGYGNVLVYWTPLVVLGFIVALAGSVRARVQERRKAYRLSLLLTLPLIATLTLSPSWWWGRLNLHVVLALYVLAALSLDRFFWWLREVICLPSLAVSLWVLLTSQPGWGVSPALAADMLAMDATERGSQQLLRRMPTPEVAIAREQELTAGTTVAIIDSFTLPGPLWNEDYSNRVIYVPWHGPAKFAAELRQSHVKWVTVRKGSKQERVILAAPTEWERVGVINPGHIAYRRRT